MAGEIRTNLLPKFEIEEEGLSITPTSPQRPKAEELVRIERSVKHFPTGVAN